MSTPDSSKMDPPLPKAQPISNARGASVITHSRKGKSNGERGMRKYRKISPTDTKVREEVVPQVLEDISLQSMVETMVKQAALLQLIEDSGSADIHSAGMQEPTLEQVNMP